ncbi:hypothetical protein ACFIOY_24560 [Bradyrhizobium sp. TZ2]
MKLKLLGAVAILSTALVTPLMAQEATQEPGMIGFTYRNSDYLLGGYGVRLPNPWERRSLGYRYGYYAPRAYYGPAYVGAPVGLAVGGAIVTAPVNPYDLVRLLRRYGLLVGSIESLTEKVA